MQKRAPSPLSARVQELRIMVGLTGRELDRLADTHVSLVESGHAGNPTLETVGKIARVFGVGLDWLVSGVGKAPSSRSVRAAVDAARASLSPDETGPRAPVKCESGEHSAADGARDPHARRSSSG